MTFDAPFRRTFRPPFGTALSTASVTPWWLSGGISASNCIAAYQPKGAADLAASYVNLANPGTYNAAPGTAPTWDAVNGWIFPGNKYLKTGVVPVVTSQSWSAIVRASGITGTSSNYIYGCYVTAPAPDARFFIVSRPTSFTEFANGAAGKIFLGRNDSAGIFAMAGKNCYFDGLLLGSDTGGNGGTLALEIYIGCANLNGSPSSYLTGNIQALAIYDMDISTYIAALNTAIAAL
jgi:hypothetical protein